MHSQQIASSSVHTKPPIPQHLRPDESLLEQWVPGCTLALEAACHESAELLPFKMRDALQGALTPTCEQSLVSVLLDLPRAVQRYTRHVLYADPKGRFTVIGLVWGPQQFSPVHAHFTWCTYRVLSGELIESHYAWDSTAKQAKLVKSVIRQAGQSACGHAGLDFIHRLGNAAADDAHHTGPAVSLHVYGIDGERSSSHVNRLLDVQ